MPGRYLLTIAEAAEALGVSKRHIERLIHEADANRRSRWRWGRELVDLSPLGSSRRTVRINLAAVVPGLSARGNPAASAADDPHG
jgi:excisionase family DNA binding protein